MSRQGRSLEKAAGPVRIGVGAADSDCKLPNGISHGKLQTAMAIERDRWPQVAMLGLLRAHEAFAAGAALGAELRAALGFAGFFVELANADFLLDAAALDELAEAADRLLSGFFVS